MLLTNVCLRHLNMCSARNKEYCKLTSGFGRDIVVGGAIVKFLTPRFLRPSVLLRAHCFATNVEVSVTSAEYLLQLMGITDVSYITSSPSSKPGNYRKREMKMFGSVSSLINFSSVLILLTE